MTTPRTRKFPISATNMDELSSTIERCNLHLKLDNPTEGYGNCFPNAIVQQCRRPEIKALLQKNKPWAIFNGQQVLRSKVTNFAINSRHATIVDLRRTYEEEIQQEEERSWTQYWSEMADDGTWVDHMFVQVTSWYMELDILILSTSSLPENPFIYICGNIDKNPGVNIGPPLLIGNYTNVHFQSLLPKHGSLSQEKKQQQKNVIEIQDRKKDEDFLFIHHGKRIIFRILEGGKFQCPYCEKLFTIILKHMSNKNCKISQSNIDLK